MQRLSNVSFSWNSKIVLIFLLESGVWAFLCSYVYFICIFFKELIVIMIFPVFLDTFSSYITPNLF